MQRWKEGDRVRIVERTVTPADTKTGLYYNYYAGLTGTLFKLYGSGTAAQAAIEVDIDSLPEDVARRHLQVRDQMLAAMPADARRQCAIGGDNEFRLRYVVLVGTDDLAKQSARRPAAMTNGTRQLIKN